MIRVAILEGSVPSLGGEAGASPSEPLHVRELALLSPRAVPKRRDDFLRGRFVAHHLLADGLSVDPGRIAVVPDSDGVPWAEQDGCGRLPISLSISHTHGVAAAAFVDLPWRVGIDVEHPIESPDSLVGDYFEACEMALCHDLDRRCRSWRAAAIWALKEAGMKSLGTGLRVPTSAVVVRAIEDQKSPTGWSRVEMVLGDTAPDPHRSLVAWIRRHASVVTALSLLVPRRGGSVPEPPSPQLLKIPL